MTQGGAGKVRGRQAPEVAATRPVLREDSCGLADPGVAVHRLRAEGARAGMADIVVKAAYGSVVEDEGMLFVGFAAGEEEDEGYVLFRQSLGGGPVWFEVSDEAFGAEDAVERVVGGPKGLEIAIAPGKLAAFGFAGSVAVRIGPQCEDATAALESLRAMLGPLFVDG
ncbi:MAG: hypothetical protein WAS26_15530 [Paracoccaceae bacterium]